MNNKVVERMMTFTVIIDSAAGQDSLGDTERNSIVVCGYFREELNLVINSLGKEVTSSAQVFLRGSDMSNILTDSLLSVGTMTGINKDIFSPIVSNKSIINKSVFYGPRSVSVIGVVYLP